MNNYVKITAQLYPQQQNYRAKYEFDIDVVIVYYEWVQ